MAYSLKGGAARAAHPLMALSTVKEASLMVKPAFPLPFLLIMA
jgi:hypothetical protein